METGRPTAGERGPCCLSAAQRGFTLVELMVGSTVLVVMISIVMRIILSGSETQRHAERVTRATELAQEIVDDLRRELGASIRIFQDDAIGASYLSMLDLTGVKPVLSRRLPTIDATGIFERDLPGSEKTGNSMLFARHAWSTTKTVSSGNAFRVDVHRLVHYYLAPDGGGPQPGSAGGVNLCKWVSEPLVDGEQIDRIVDPTDRTELLQHLRNQTADDAGVTHARVEVAWSKGLDPATVGALRHIQTDGSLNDAPQAPRTSPWRFLRTPRLSVDGSLQYRHFSVASNYGRSTLGVGRFALVNLGAQFPHGCEFQVLGPASARQVLVNLILVSDHNAGQNASARLQVIVAARDI
jgi:prepilin-type N-terminal cleavage/methylation domain-containing protein